MGAVGALVLAAVKGRLGGSVIPQALASTTRLSSFVMFILVGARVFSLTFYGVNGHLWVEHLLTSLPGGEYGFLLVVSVAGVLPGVLSRLLRTGLHHRAAAGTGGRKHWAST